MNADEQDQFRLTTCYAADRCQGDLGCPHPPGCLTRDDDGEPWWLISL